MARRARLVRRVKLSPPEVSTRRQRPCRACLARRGAARVRRFLRRSARVARARPDEDRRDLLTRSRSRSGDLHNVWVAWRNMDAFGGHIFRRWMENSLLYSLGATAIAIAVGVPAGYGLATGRFRGRRLVLSLTLIAMLIPASSLVLPIYLELNAMRLIGNVFSIILPFAFFPLASTSPTSTTHRASAGAARRRAGRRLQRAADVPSRRAAPREAGRRARLLLQLRRGLEQLLPALRDPAGPEQFPVQVGLLASSVVTPSRCTRDADRGAARRDRLRRLAAGPRTRCGRRRNQG